MTCRTFEQFHRFTTDAYGLERTLRAIQASAVIYLALYSTLLSDTITYPSAESRTLGKALSSLSDRLGLIRRFFRLFRFFDSFTNSFDAFNSLQTPKDNKRAPRSESTSILAITLDGLAASFNGLYLFLEAVTIVDALAIEEIAIFGPELEHRLKIESQRSWLIALGFGACACLVRLWDIAKPLSHATQRAKSTSKRCNVDQNKTWTTQQWRLWGKLTTCLLDMALPGSVIGLIPASKGTVGMIMLSTSILTGLDVWERCGKEIGKNRYG